MNNTPNIGSIINASSRSEGIVIGPVWVIDEEKKIVPKKRIDAKKMEEHLHRYVTAKNKVLAELDTNFENLNTITSEILEVQKHIISDPHIDHQVQHLIKTQCYSVDYAIYETFVAFIEKLKESGSELFQQRIIDLENLRDRLIALSCEDEFNVKIPKGAILIIKEISPMEIINYYEQGISGLVTDRGGVVSHAAIIAQSLDLPCLVSAKHAVRSSTGAKYAVLDANEGKLILDPKEEILQHYKKRFKEIQKQQKKLRNKEISNTKDGVPFILRANVEFIQELPLVKSNKALGIGLLRTEVLLYGDIKNRSENKQDDFYSTILKKSKGPVTIRLFDVGGDKLSVATKKEDNPALGWRGIRVLLEKKELLHTQLRSILKVSGKYPNRVRILLPMVSMVEEIYETKEAIVRAKEELEKENIPIQNDIPLGVMIEIPSVAMLVHHFAKEVDFFSIGTNDLTQYVLAVDRGNEQISTLYQHYHPAIWQFIHHIKKTAIAKNIKVNVCGELAGDLIGAACLMGLNINDLSMSPAHLPKIKNLLSGHPQEYFQKFANKVLEMSSSKEVQLLFKEFFGV